MYQGPHLCNSRGQLEVSICFSVFLTIPVLAGFSDVSPEELRLEYYDSRSNNIIGNYVSTLKMLAGVDISQDRTCYCSSGDNS